MGGKSKTGRKISTTNNNTTYRHPKVRVGVELPLLRSQLWLELFHKSLRNGTNPHQNHGTKRNKAKRHETPREKMYGTKRNGLT